MVETYNVYIAHLSGKLKRAINLQMLCRSSSAVVCRPSTISNKIYLIPDGQSCLNYNVKHYQVREKAA